MQLFGGKGKMLGLLLVLAAFGSFIWVILPRSQPRKKLSQGLLSLLLFCWPAFPF